MGCNNESVQIVASVGVQKNEIGLQTAVASFPSSLKHNRIYQHLVHNQEI